MSPMSDDFPPSAEEDISDERLPLTDLESLPAGPPSWRKRGVQAALVICALGVALAVLWNTIVPTRRLPTPGPTGTAVSVLLVSNLSNATITFNGKKVARQLPLVVSGFLEANELTISAPLFRRYTCHFEGLRAKEDETHCLAASGSNIQMSAVLAFGIFLTLADLLPTQQRIIAPIMQQLSTAQQASVSLGDTIATAFDRIITSQSAPAPLEASATFVQANSLAAHVPFPYGFSPLCTQLLCPRAFSPDLSAKPAGQVWALLLNVMLRWRFIDDAGATVADVTYPADPTEGLEPSLVPVQFNYDGSGWHLAADPNLSQQMQDELCETGKAILGQRYLEFSGVSILSDRGAQGCLLSLQTSANGNVQDIGTFLWRFGVLLAADAGAHTFRPDLPIASRTAIAAAGG